MLYRQLWLFILLSECIENSHVFTCSGRSFLFIAFWKLASLALSWCRCKCGVAQHQARYFQTFCYQHETFPHAGASRKEHDLGRAMRRLELLGRRRRGTEGLMVLPRHFTASPFGHATKAARSGGFPVFALKGSPMPAAWSSKATTGEVDDPMTDGTTTVGGGLARRRR
jgi:hypothetical protein